MRCITVSASCVRENMPKLHYTYSGNYNKILNECENSTDYNNYVNNYRV